MWIGQGRDVELGEGSTWEAAMSASHHSIDNLIAVVDFNNQQADGPSQSMLCSEPLESKWESFGWLVWRVDGNDIESLSIDGVGFNGPLLRELQDPDGLAVETFVPPKKTPAAKFYMPEDFVEDPQHGSVTCPAGQTSLYRQRNGRSIISDPDRFSLMRLRS